VGGHREELGLLLGRALQPFVGVLEHAQHPAALGRVARDLGVADELTLVVPDGGDGDVGPELASVLADAPALLLVATVPPGHRELVLGMPRGLLPLGVEHPEVATDDLLRRITVAALGAGVPAGHTTVGIEHEDRVVLDRLDQQPEPLLGPAQPLFSHPLTRHLLHLQEEVERAFHGVEHGRRRHLEAPLGVGCQRVLDLDGRGGLA
jgi:hypothetical protein